MRFVGVSVVLEAPARITPSRTPAIYPAAMADAGSGHADTINSRPKRTASEGGSRGYAVRPLKWCERQCGLRSCREGQGERRDSDQPDHWSLLGYPRVRKTPSRYARLAALVFLVVASCRVRQRYFAGIAKIADFSFQAGFSFAPASLHACAMLFHVIRTGLGVYGLDQDVLAPVGQVLDVRLEAFPILPPPGSTPGHCALASFKQAPDILPTPWKMGAATWRRQEKEHS